MAGARPRALTMEDNAFYLSPWKLHNVHPRALAPIPLLELV